jgi:hypothetical protein
VVFIPDEVKESIIACREVKRVALHYAISDSDYRDIITKVEEMIGDSDNRKRILNCIANYDSPRKRFCCLLDTLNLAKLKKKYCRLRCALLVLEDVMAVLMGLLFLAGIFAIPFLPIIIGSLFCSYGKICIEATELLIAVILWVPIAFKIYMKIGDWLIGWDC